MANHPAEPADAALVADWTTIWQSEWAAIAVDQEVSEASQRMATLWAGQAQAAVERLAADAAADQRPWAASPARTPPVADAPDAGLGDRAEPVPRPAPGSCRP